VFPPLRGLLLPVLSVKKVRYSRSAGLTGNRGVIIPKQNVRNLMLNETIVSTVKKENFYIWAIETVSEGIEILTGIKAGRRRKNNTYTPGSFFAKERYDWANWPEQ
jgi:predicted ATP-dependent protease